MRGINIPPAIILLLDGKAIADNEIVKEWFRNSRFLTNETTDIFQVLEDISDFTQRSRPDVVLLEVNSPEQDFPMVQNVLKSMLGDDDYSILSLSEKGQTVNNRECFEGNLTQLKAQLEKMIPRG